MGRQQGGEGAPRAVRGAGAEDSAHTALPVSYVRPKLGSHSVSSGPRFAAEAEKEGLAFEVRDISSKGGMDFMAEFLSLERLSGPG